MNLHQMCAAGRLVTHSNDSMHGNRTFVLFVCQRKDTDHMLSHDTVSFHYVSPGQMYMFDFLLYQLNRHWTSSTNNYRRHLMMSAVVTIATPSSMNSTRNQTVTS